MIKKIFFTLLFLTFGLITYSQNQFHMSQSMMYQPFINPAVIGSYDNLNGALFYKNQWTGFDGAPEIGGFSINTPIKKTNHSIGLTVVNDRVGISNNSEIFAAYSYKLKFNNSNYVTLGIAGSMMLMQSNLAELDIIQESDPIFQSNTRTFVMPNAKFGAYYFRNKFYFGLAMPNLFKNNIEISQFTNFDPSNIHYFIHSGYQFDINKDWEAQTSVLFKHVAGAPLQVDINGQFVYNNLIGVGLCYRTSQELTAMLNYRISGQLKVGYAYDYNMRTIGNYSNGTHEIVLLFDLIKEKTTPIIEVHRF